MSTWTKEQAFAAAEEAKQQGWAEDINAEGYRGDNGEILVFGAPYTDGTPGEWWVTELRMAGAYHNEVYYLRQWDEWRQLKAKTDEIKQILAEAAEKGYRVDGFGSRIVKKTGKLGMYVEIYFPGDRPPYPHRVGGMRTWRKLCRETEAIIEASPSATKELTS